MIRSLCSLATGLALFTFFISTTVALSNDISFVEKFVLASDRASFLRELIPGTEDHYFYHALHLQHTTQHKAFNDLMAEWAKRHPKSSQRTILKNRQALLDYEHDPAGTLEYLKKVMNVRFNHQRDRRQDDPELPEQLDPASITSNAFAERALKERDDLDRVTNLGLENLIQSGQSLSDGQRRALLVRLNRPDFPLLVRMIQDDLKTKESRGWGSLPIHHQLLKSQMDELLTNVKSLRSNEVFIKDYLYRLAPNDDASLARDTATRQAYLERLWAFVETLPASFNSLKAHTLYHYLHFDRSQGRYNRDRFLDYLKLPREVAYMNRDYLIGGNLQQHTADLKANFKAHTTLPTVGNEQSLLVDYLQHFFLEAKSIKPFSKYLSESFLNPLFATTKILAAKGKQEEWYSWLQPTEYKQLLDRVDIDFAPENATQSALHTPVTIAANVKNVSNLIIKVYEIHTKNYYQQHKREIHTDLNLDGLVPNEELTFEYTEPPLRKVRREFTFESLQGKRGAWMIEFIGNGKSSRALIRRGSLHTVSRSTADGELTFVLNERHEVVKDASIWLGNREFTSDHKDGGIVIPFSSQSGSKPAVLTDGHGFASLETVQVRGEKYQFHAGLYINREQLTPGQAAQILVRPQLLLNGVATSLALIEDSALTLNVTDQGGIETSQRLPLPLAGDREAIHTFKVPERMASLTATLSGKIKRLSDGREIDLADDESFHINGIDASAQTADFQLSRTANDWHISMVGKNGEPLSQRAVLVEVRHRGFKDDFEVLMQTNEAGRIALGSLTDIARIKASADGYEAKRWYLPSNHAHYPANVHAAVGDTVSIPYVGQANVVSREIASLMETRRGVAMTDHFSRLKLEGGFLTLSELPAGNYELFLKESQQAFTVRISEGHAVAGLVLGKHRQLSKRNETPLHITSIVEEAEAVQIQLAHADVLTRVHVVATRHVPAFALDEQLAITTAEPYEITLAHRPNLFTSGRKIGEEYRYVINRRYATKYPGNLLTRPSVILNPWEQRDTEANLQAAAADEVADRLSRAMPASRKESMKRMNSTAAPSGLRDFANLDYLAGAGVLLANLKPDEQGRIAIPRAALNGRQHLQILAVDLDNTILKHVYLPETDLAPRDRAFAAGIPANEHFSEQKAVSILKEGESLVIRDLAAADLEIYDTLSKVHLFFATQSDDNTLTEFDFVLRWPSLETDKKRALYSKHACHELSFFIAHKDPAFFSQVVRPYLANKLEQTFLDHYLLDHDLSQYLKAWRFARLNIAERALLAKRLGGNTAAGICRHLQELLALKPADPEAEHWGFQSALLGLQLGRNDDTSRRYAYQEQQLGESDSIPLEDAAPVAMAIADLENSIDAFELEGDEEMQESLKQDGASLSGGGRDARGRQGRSLRRRLQEAAPRFYQKPDASKEWAENHYHNVPQEQQTAELIGINGFWNDYATWSGDGAFLSKHLTEATQNFAEMMLALSVLDLPFEAVEHEETLEEGQFTLSAHSDLLVFRSEIMPAPEAKAATPLLVNQNFYRHGHRYQLQGSEQVDQFVSDEFLTGIPYSCEVVITNPTSTLQKVQVLTQIPAQAIPVLSSQSTKSVPLRLEPYSTQKLEYHFYFPTSGTHAQFPVHVAKGEQTIAFAAPVAFNAVVKPIAVDAQSWEYVSQWSSDAEMMAYLETHNLQHLDLSRMAWRLKDLTVFNNVLALMQQRHVYDETIYSYALHHGLPAPLKQYLQHHDRFVAQCGSWLDSPLLAIDATERDAYQQLEYTPLVNPRAHALGGDRKILNDAFHAQYHRLLNILQFKPSIKGHDQLSVVYYLFLQDRVTEALARLDHIDPFQLNGRLQYDYFQAYAAFYREDLSSARQIALTYADYPILRWQAAFANITNQLDEIEGKPMTAPNPKDRDKRQEQLASKEPHFQFKVVDGEIQLTHKNLTQVVLNYYEMDIEFLFSSNPFVTQGSDRFGIIKPNLSERRQWVDNNGTQTLALPESVHGKNVLIEIEGGGRMYSQAHYSHKLDVQVAENYGHVQVSHASDQRPLSKVYIKVYARKKDGQNEFYKDGYTDLRGKFDYASLNANTIDSVSALSLLVMSPEHGAVIREVKPPQE